MKIQEIALINPRHLPPGVWSQIRGGYYSDYPLAVKLCDEEVLVNIRDMFALMPAMNDVFEEILDDAFSRGATWVLFTDEAELLEDYITYEGAN